MKVNLEKLSKDGRLDREEGIGFDQIVRRIERAKIDLENAKIVLKKDESGAFRLAYDAMLQSGIALILSHGYRPKVKNFHKTVVEATNEIFGDKFGVLMKKFNQMRKTRHDAIYDISFVSKAEAEDSIIAAGKLIQEVSKTIKENNPQKELL